MSIAALAQLIDYFAASLLRILRYTPSLIISSEHLLKITATVVSSDYPPEITATVVSPSPRGPYPSTSPIACARTCIWEVTQSATYSRLASQAKCVQQPAPIRTIL